MFRFLKHLFPFYIVSKKRINVEYYRINVRLNELGTDETRGNLEYRLFYSAQQALGWVQRPDGAKSPFETVYSYLLQGTDPTLEGCQMVFRRGMSLNTSSPLEGENKS